MASAILEGCTPAVLRASRVPAALQKRLLHAVVLQIFVCAEDENAECFQECIVSGGGADDSPASWLVRVVQLAPGAVQDPAAIAAARAELGEEQFFIDQRVITGWAAGRPEMMHEDANYDFDEELYEDHQPASGLKLLGFPVQGRIFAASDSAGSC